MNAAHRSADLLESLPHEGVAETLREQFGEFILPSPECTALDVECGLGHMSMLLASRTASVVGIDSSMDHVLRAEQHPFAQTCSNLRFQNVSPTSLPFGSGSFDLVCSQGILHRLADPRPFLAEVYRVMKVGATYGAVIPSARLTLPRLAEFLNQDPQASPLAIEFREMCRSGTQRFSERSLTRMLLESGLRAIRTVEFAEGLLLFVKAWR